MGDNLNKRYILHVDMDAFFASIEQVERPWLRGKPVIIGGDKRGVVCAASYEARRFGVHSAMPVLTARHLCPKGIFLPVRKGLYTLVSERIMAILRSYSPLVEKASVDEAYIDATGMERLFGPPDRMARRIKSDIVRKTGLTCSIGIAPNKFLAKIASDMDKPDGLTFVSHEMVEGFMLRLPMAKIPGVGPEALKFFNGLGIKYVSDFLGFAEEYWIKRLGRAGKELFDKARGIDNSPVLPFSPPKSFSAEYTLSYDTGNIKELKRHLLHQVERVGRSLRRSGYMGRTVSLKIKFSDFRIVTRSRTFPDATSSTRRIYEAALNLLDDLELPKKVRLVGVGVSNLSKGVRQVAIFDQYLLEKERKIDRVVDEIRERFGDDIVKRGYILGDDNPSQ